MTIQTRSRFIRCRVDPSVQRSLFLSDLDYPDTRRSMRDKVPMYIPVGTPFIDIPLTDRVLQSYNTGTIRGFINQGLIEAYILEQDGTRTNQISEDTGLVEFDTGSGDLLGTLPSGLPLGSVMIFKKISPDGNIAGVQAGAGDTLEGGLQILNTQGDVLMLKLGPSRVWRIINTSSGGGGGGSVVSVTGNLVNNTDPTNPVIDQVISADSNNTAQLGSDGLLFVPATSLTLLTTNTSVAPLFNTCVVATPPAFGLTIFLPDSTELPGGIVEVVKFTTDASPVFVAANIGEPIYGSAILTAPYEVAGWRSLNGSWIRIY
jgi:hypothetical protein